MFLFYYLSPSFVLIFDSGRKSSWSAIKAIFPVKSEITTYYDFDYYRFSKDIERMASVLYHHYSSAEMEKEALEYCLMAAEYPKLKNKEKRETIFKRREERREER